MIWIHNIDNIVLDNDKVKRNKKCELDNDKKKKVDQMQKDKP